MTIYYLYKKTHTKTGLNYLGYTTRDPYKYKGSGIEWGKHLREHGDKIDTVILAESANKTEIQFLGRHYSELWDIVKSSAWANSMKETCGGPGGIKGIPRSNDTKEKIRNQLIGRKHTTEQNIAKSQRQRGKKKSKERVDKMTGRKNPLISEKLSGKSKPIVQCPHCKLEGGVSAMHRWHFSSCGLNPDKS